MEPKLLLSTLLGSIVVMLVAACGSSSGTADGNAGGSAKTTQQTTQRAYSPRIVPAEFTTNIDNKYFTLKPGTTLVYRGKTKDATVGDVVAVTSDTKQIMGVECVVVDDKVTEDSKLAEQTYDWYAQDNKATSGTSGRTPKRSTTARLRAPRARGKPVRTEPSPGP